MEQVQKLVSWLVSLTCHMVDRAKLLFGTNFHKTIHCGVPCFISVIPPCLPGDHKQARKAQLQSRAELHKARLDALNATQRHTSAAAARHTTQAGASPMTQRAIADLTAAQLPASASKPSVGQVPAQPAAVTTAPPATEAAQKSSSHVKEASTVREASAPPAAVKAAAPAAAAAAHRSNEQQQPAGNQRSAGAAAAGRQYVSVDIKEKRAMSPSSSRQAPKRRRSRSVSPSVAGSRGGGRSQPGSQKQVVTSARRPATRSALLRLNSGCQYSSMAPCMQIQLLLHSM